MPNIVGRKGHREERAELWIILVPMIVKTFHRVGSSSFSQQQWRSWVQFCELCSSASVRWGAESVEIMGKKLHHVGIVSKVDSFDLTSHNALTHQLLLASNP